MKALKNCLIWLIVLAIVVSIATGTVSVNAENSSYINDNTNAETSYSDYVDFCKKVNAKVAQSDINIAISNLETLAVNENINNGDALTLNKDSSATFSFVTEQEGLYNINLFIGNINSSAKYYDYSLQIDGKYPFKDCEKLTANVVFVDDGEIRELNNGDQINPSQKQKEGYVWSTVYDSSGLVLEPYEFYFSVGYHTITIKCNETEFLLAGIKLTSPEQVKPYSVVSQNYDTSENYSGEPIVIEAENSLYKNSYNLTAKSDRTTANVSPSSSKNLLINYIGGASWNGPGSEITWKFNVPENGLYKLAINFKQTGVQNGSVYRWLKIDGRTPFEETKDISFDFKNSWQFVEFENKDGEDYLFYLEEGEHKISLAVTLSDVAEVSNQLNSIVTALGDLYLDMVMITSESPDTNRNYQLNKQIPNFENRLNEINTLVKKLSNDIDNGLRVNMELNGALRNMSRIINNMLSSIYNSHLQIPTYYSQYQTLTAWLQDIKDMPLSVDKIIFSSPEDDLESLKTNFVGRMFFSLKRFLSSFVNAYKSVDVQDKEKSTSIKIWTSAGRDQVRILNALIQSDFTPKNNISVELEQVNATVVQGAVSNNLPDVFFHLARSQPVNYAMRGILYDLKNFSDYEQVLKRFHPGAETPYLYRDGCYALPDTQNFDVMFYRTDILEQLGIPVPKSWDEFLTATGILQRNQMNTYLSYTKLVDATTVNQGAGALSIFPTMLIQTGESLYNKELNTTNLASKKSVKAFTFWTDFYSKYSLDPNAQFAQKFRVGTIPLGITSYTNYYAFKVTSPQIAGKWAIAEVPGLKNDDGSINNSTCGFGTGCVITRDSKNKDAAWEFLKWWTSTETQYCYYTELEAVLGESGMGASSNIEAVKSFQLESDAKDVIFSQWSNVVELNEVPGSYYVSRSIDQAFWATKNGKQSSKEAIVDWSDECNREIERKIAEYANKNYN